MKSNFDKYIKSASCYLHDCPYGYDISCRECVNRMIAEHDAKVRADAIDELKDLIISLYADSKDKTELCARFRDRAEEMKEQKEWEHT